MTAGGEHTGLHKRWLERKLEIEVGKVQAKLLSKGLSVPIPDPEDLESEARLSQSHLPKLYIDLYGRNPNGTLKISPDANRRSGSPPTPTVVQKLDRILNPAMLTPIPLDVALAYGLPLSCCDASELAPTTSGGAARRSGGGGGGSSPPAGGGRGMLTHIRHGTAPQAHGGLHGSLSVVATSGAPTESGASAAVMAGPGSGPGGSPRMSRSSPLPGAAHVRPDLQAVDGRIEEAVAEVYRVALQANEMCPRERVLYLARQANPHFALLQPRTAGQLIPVAGAPSRKEMFRKYGSRRVASFIPDPIREVGGQKVQTGGGPRRSITYADNCRSQEASITSLQSPGGGGSGGTLSGDGGLPPLGGQSRAISRANSGREQAAAAATAAAEQAAAAAAASREGAAEPTEGLPRLHISATLVPPVAESGEPYVPPLSPVLPKIPSALSVVEGLPGSGRSSGQTPRADFSMVGAAALVRAAELQAARAALEAQAQAEAEAAAEEAAEEEEAGAAAAEAEAEAEAAAVAAALEAEAEAAVRAPEGLLAQAPGPASDGGAPSTTVATATTGRGQEWQPLSSGHGGGAGSGDGSAASAASSHGWTHPGGHAHSGPGWMY